MKPKPIYKRKAFWTALVSAAAVAFDLTVAEQSATVQVIMLVFG